MATTDRPAAPLRHEHRSAVKGAPPMPTREGASRGWLGRPRTWVAAAAAVAVLSGCTISAGEEEPAQSVPITAGPDTGEVVDHSTPSDEQAPEGLEDFYSQELAWYECEGGAFECSDLEVPLDYADPGRASIHLSLLRIPARQEAQGSLVLNPGGPGGSGVDYAMISPMVLSKSVMDVYDIVGFDPRGVARSAPVVCFTDEQMDELMGSDPTPDDEAEEAANEELMGRFVQACEDNAGEILPHVSTVEAARDMDILRAAVGDASLHYLGASYGTFLGTTYAALFPEKVGRLVLDGAIEPQLTGMEISLGQAGGFETATRAYVQWCIDQGNCPLGDELEPAMAAIPLLLDGLDSEPIPVTGDVTTELNEGWGMLGIIAAMYHEGIWPILTQALKGVQEGDGTSMMFLANMYASRDSQGAYDGNTMQAIYAVNCLDRYGEDSGEVELEKMIEQFEEVSPTWGRYLAGEGVCGQWPVQAQEQIEDYAAVGAAPIVVIGTTRDPATPYEWAVGLAEILDSGVLISYDGDGHTAYGRSNSCVDSAVDAYLIDGVVPQDGLSC